MTITWRNIGQTTNAATGAQLLQNAAGGLARLQNTTGNLFDKLRTRQNEAIQQEADNAAKLSALKEKLNTSLSADALNGFSSQLFDTYGTAEELRQGLKTGAIGDAINSGDKYLNPTDANNAVHNLLNKLEGVDDSVQKTKESNSRLATSAANLESTNLKNSQTKKTIADTAATNKLSNQLVQAYQAEEARIGETLANVAEYLNLPDLSPETLSKLPPEKQEEVKQTLAKAGIGSPTFVSDLINKQLPELASGLDTSVVNAATQQFNERIAGVRSLNVNDASAQANELALLDAKEAEFKKQNIYYDQTPATHEDVVELTKVFNDREFEDGELVGFNGTTTNQITRQLIKYASEGVPVTVDGETVYMPVTKPMLAAAVNAIGSGQLGDAAEMDSALRSFFTEEAFPKAAEAELFAQTINKARAQITGKFTPANSTKAYKLVNSLSQYTGG